MSGRIVVSLILGSAVLMGGFVYYFQVFAFYDEVSLEVRGVRLTSLVTGEPEAIIADDVQAIDAESSPLRFRACFQTSMSHALLTETYELYEAAVPTTAPGWFDCFDAEDIGSALEVGTALAFLGEKHIEFGIDRIVAIRDDGRGFVWHQINDCGAVVFDGKPAPEGCPRAPANDDPERGQ